MKIRQQTKNRLLVVDGYNILNAIAPLKHTTGTLADARDALAMRLEDYAGFSGQKIILVYDAWLSDRMQRSKEEHGALTVVFTRKGETADHYIERLCDEYAEQVSYGRLEIRVATSDNVEQTVVFGRGAVRISARELLYELESAGKQRMEQTKSEKQTEKGALMDRLPPEIREKLEKMRRGEIP